MKKVEKDQQVHYDEIANDYSLHYGDQYSQQYRKKYIYDRLFESATLKGSLILEAMCGSGEATEYLMSQGATVIGLDISFNELVNYQKSRKNSKTICSSAFAIGAADGYFDSVVVIGGLHHLHPQINKALIELSRVLKPGGAVYLSEPHKGSLFDLVRRAWYRVDRLFLENESAIDIQKMISDNSNLFSFKELGYYGNLAYIFVFNSMVLRMPKWLKKIYSPLLLNIEGPLSKIQNRVFSCFVLIKASKK